MSEKLDDLTEIFLDSIPYNLTGEEKETFKTMQRNMIRYMREHPDMDVSDFLKNSKYKYK